MTNFKVGASSLLAWLPPEYKPLYEYGPTLDVMFKDYTKIFIKRDPYDRFLSYYLNRIAEHRDPDVFRRMNHSTDEFSDLGNLKNDLREPKYFMKFMDLFDATFLPIIIVGPNQTC